MPIDHPPGTTRPDWEEGAIVKGCVKRVEPDGVWVELENGAEGVIANTQTAAGAAVRPKDILRPGQPIDVRVERVNREQGSVRITLKRADREDCDTDDANDPDRR
jgi:small subunit ribosomal protein S1